MTISSLTPKDVTKFIQDRVRQLSPGRARLLVTALRSFLRYLRHQDQISIDLAGCVPAVACWSLSTVPKFLPAGTVQRVLSQCERETADGKRNYAVLLMLARLGLRACEIVALNLDDIDWDHGLLTIRCKGGRWAQWPMPTDVGEAIATYVHSGRPGTQVPARTSPLWSTPRGIKYSSPASKGRGSPLIINVKEPWTTIMYSS